MKYDIGHEKYIKYALYNIERSNALFWLANLSFATTACVYIVYDYQCLQLK